MMKNKEEPKIESQLWVSGPKKDVLAIISRLSEEYATVDAYIKSRGKSIVRLS